MGFLAEAFGESQEIRGRSPSSTRDGFRSSSLEVQKKASFRRELAGAAGRGTAFSSAPATGLGITWSVGTTITQPHEKQEVLGRH